MTVTDPPGQKAAVQDFFDAGADSWRARYFRRDFESVSYQDRMARALGFIRRHAPEHALVLDAGCGAGVQAAAVQAMGHRVVACDLAPEMARRAGSGLKDGDGGALVADLERLPFPPETFDVAVSLGVIGYADRPEALLAALRRVLKPGGVLVISTASERLLLTCVADKFSVVPNRVYLWLKHTLFRRKSTPRAWDTGFYQDHYHYTTAPAFDRFLAEGGFRKLDSAGVNYGRLHFSDKHPWPERWDVLLTRMVARLARLGPLRALQRYARIYVACMVKDGSQEPRAPGARATPP